MMAMQEMPTPKNESVSAKCLNCVGDTSMFMEKEVASMLGAGQINVFTISADIFWPIQFFSMWIPMKWRMGSRKLVCYIMQTLSIVKRIYVHMKKKGLALVFAVEKDYKDIFLSFFTFYIDYKSLQGLFTKKKPILPPDTVRFCQILPLSYLKVDWIVHTFKKALKKRKQL